METIESIRDYLTRLQGQKFQIEKSIKEKQTEIRYNERELRNHEKAREIVKQIGMKTQQQLQFHISEITTLAMDAVFDDPYSLEVEFVQRRNKTECDLYFKKGENLFSPTDASGGGVVDVASFTLRIASWSMMQPMTRSVIILDEPLRFLSKDHQEKASKMIKELSEKLGLQFIIVTHEEMLTEYADKIFQVSKKGQISKVKEL